MLWDVFCRVIDNHGDLGVCWRLSADLAARGEQVRLWVDEPDALRWMAPDGCAGVELRLWREPFAELPPGDVVVEAFGCDPPDRFVAGMARAARPPVWINLEYLSAEDYVERSHGLMSPVLSGPGAGLHKWFFYPGFTPRTGGLLREPDLARRQAAFDRADWLSRRATPPLRGERVVSLFCYRHAPAAALLQRLQDRPTLLLLTPGIATELVGAALAAPVAAHRTQIVGALRVHALPHLSQPDFDALLWSCDLNFVRGEDSFVRAQWAGVPLVWHIYPQDDGVHADKLDAFWRRYSGTGPSDTARTIRQCWRWWNGLDAAAPPRLDDTAWSDWSRVARDWRRSLLEQPDLTSALQRFVLRQRAS